MEQLLVVAGEVKLAGMLGVAYQAPACDHKAIRRPSATSVRAAADSQIRTVLSMCRNLHK